MVLRIRAVSRCDRHKVRREGSDVCRAWTRSRVSEAALTGPSKAAPTAVDFEASPLGSDASPFGNAKSRSPKDRSAMSTSFGRADADGSSISASGI